MMVMALLISSSQSRKSRIKFHNLRWIQYHQRRLLLLVRLQRSSSTSSTTRKPLSRRRMGERKRAQMLLKQASRSNNQHQLLLLSRLFRMRKGQEGKVYPLLPQARVLHSARRLHPRLATSDLRNSRSQISTSTTLIRIQSLGMTMASKIWTSTSTTASMRRRGGTTPVRCRKELR